MRRSITAAAVVLVAALALLASGCNKLKARDNLNKGVNSFKAAQYTAAADSFKEAIELDPDLPSARLYLATAYMTQYVPGSEAPENKRNADSALKEFQTALNSNLDDKNEADCHAVARRYSLPLERLSGVGRMDHPSDRGRSVELGSVLHPRRDCVERLVRFLARSH